MSPDLQKAVWRPRRGRWLTLLALFRCGAAVPVGPAAADTPACGEWVSAVGSLFFIRADAPGWLMGTVRSREWWVTEGATDRLLRTIENEALARAARRGSHVPWMYGADLRRAKATLAEQWGRLLLADATPPSTLTQVLSPVDQIDKHRGEPPPPVRSFGGHIGFARVQCPRYNALYLHRLDREAWFYFEQPDPLPPGQAALTPEDVFRPEFLAAQRAQLTTGESAPGSLMVRTLFRRRGFDPLGPFEPVRILFCHVTLAETLDLRAPGYP